MIWDEIETVETTSPTPLEEETEQLKHIFPQVFSEGKIDFKKLRATLGEAVDTQPERYSFTWAGKRSTTQLLQTPSYGTLTPAADESVNFEGTQNLFIEGDNLEVLKLLYKSYAGRIKMIYIDPPYNTGNDFIYPDNFADPLETYLEITGQKDANGNLLTSNPETSGRYHSAWLSMMYPRLYLARQLLRDDGVIFVSIDDHEVCNLRLLMNEVFGEENFLGQIVWKNVTDNNPTRIAVEHEYILVFARDKDRVTPIWKSSNYAAKDILVEIGEQLIEKYGHDQQLLSTAYKEWFASNRKFLGQLDRYKYIDSQGVYTGSQSVHNPGREGYRYDVMHPVTGKPCKQPLMGYRFPKETLEKLINEGKVLFGDDETKIIELKVYAKDYVEKLPSVLELDGRLGSYDIRELFADTTKLFDNPKPKALLEQLISFVTEGEDLVLDFFAGSCTTAQAVLDLNREDNGNRRFILVQLPQPTDNSKYPTIADIGKERIRRVISKIKQEDEGRLSLSTRKGPEDLGFRVFKLVPSNYRQWKGIDASDPKAYESQLDMFADPLVEDWQPLNVLWEVAIKEGYGLNAEIERLGEIPDNAVWRITDRDKDQSMLVCLDDELTPATQAALPLSKEHIFVCRNKALDDTKAANLALDCRLKKI